MGPFEKLALGALAIVDDLLPKVRGVPRDGLSDADRAWLESVERNVLQMRVGAERLLNSCRVDGESTGSEPKGE